MKAFSVPDATVLILDSEPVMRAVMRDALQDAGYLVIEAGDLGDAVSRLKECRPDLLITRPYINSMPGRMAADYLRSKCPGLPVLIVSGCMDDQRVNDQNLLGELHVFPKPFAREEFLAAVKQVVETARKSPKAGAAR